MREIFEQYVRDRLDDMTLEDFLEENDLDVIELVMMLYDMGFIDFDESIN